MFVTGFPAEEMDESFRALVKDKKVGNVILFKDNLKSAEQIVGLSRDIRALIYGETGEYPLITVDEEGGVVSRLPESMGKMPSAMALSALHEPDEIYQAARMSGKQLCALGMNFNLAPVLDVNSNAANPVIGIRSYGQKSAGCLVLCVAGDARISGCGCDVFGQAFSRAWRCDVGFPFGASGQRKESGRAEADRACAV